MTFRKRSTLFQGRARPWVRTWTTGETPTTPPLGWPGRQIPYPHFAAIDFFPSQEDDLGIAPSDRTWKTQMGTTAPGNSRAGDWIYSNEIRSAGPLIEIPNWTFWQLLVAGYIDWNGQWLLPPPPGHPGYVNTGSFLRISGSPATEELRAYFSGKRFKLTWAPALGANPNINDTALTIVDGNGTLVNLGTRQIGYICSASHSFVRLRFTLSGSADITKHDHAQVSFVECDENWDPVDSIELKNVFVEQMQNYDVRRHMDELGGGQPMARSHLEFCDMTCAFRNKSGIGNYEGLGGKPHREIFALDHAIGCHSWINTPALLGNPFRYFQISRSNTPTVTMTGDMRGKHLVPGSFGNVVNIGSGIYDVDNPNTVTPPAITGPSDATLTIGPNGELFYDANSTMKTTHYFDAFTFQYQDTLAGVQQWTIAFRHGGSIVLVEPSVSAYFNANQIFASPWIRQYCEYILDELVASGVPGTHVVYIEVSNEKWNSGNEAFGQNRRHFQGLGGALGQHKSHSWGGGWFLARVIHEMSLAQTARGSNWKFFWVVAGQTVQPSSTQGQYEALASYFSANGLTMSDHFGPNKGGTFLTTYTEGLLGQNGVVPIPNQGDAGAARYNEIEARILANEEGFWQDCFNYITSEATIFREPRTFGGILNSFAEHHAIAQTYGARLEGCYEGDWHEDDVDHRPIIYNSYVSHIGGPWGVNVRTKFHQRILELYPWFMMANYGHRGWFPNGGPWLEGFISSPLTGYDNMWKMFGRNP